MFKPGPGFNFNEIGKYINHYEIEDIIDYAIKQQDELKKQQKNTGKLTDFIVKSYEVCFPRKNIDPIYSERMFYINKNSSPCIKCNRLQNCTDKYAKWISTYVPIKSKSPESEL